MKKPVLVVMAAGMGSRYGGLKQIDPVDKEGHIIMDFSVYDAVRAGFEKVIFIIKRENEEAFRKAIGDRLSKNFRLSMCFRNWKIFRKVFRSRKEEKSPGEQDMRC